MCDVNREEEREPSNRTVNLCEVNREGKRESATASAQPTLFVASRPHLHFSLSLCLTPPSFLLVTSLRLQIVLDQFSFSSGRVQLATKNAAIFFVILSINVKSLPLITNWKNILKNIEIFCAVILDYYIHANELK